MTEMRTAPIENGHLAYLECGTGTPVVLLRHLDTGPAVLVGLSMGAGTAVDVAVEYPELVSALVGSGTGTSEPAWQDPWIIDWFATLARKAEGKDGEGWLDTFLQLGNGPHRRLDDVDPQVVAELREQGATTLATHVPNGEPVLPSPVADAWQRSRGLDVPVLAVIGGTDADDHIRMARELAESAADGRSVTIEGTAHYPNMERPEEFNRAVLEFLDDLTRR